MAVVHEEPQRTFHGQHERRRVGPAGGSRQRPLQREVQDGGAGLREVEHRDAVALLRAARRRVDEVRNHVPAAVERPAERGGILRVAGVEPPAFAVDVRRERDRVARKVLHVHGLHELAQLFKRPDFVFRREGGGCGREQRDECERHLLHGVVPSDKWFVEKAKATEVSLQHPTRLCGDVELTTSTVSGHEEPHTP